MGKKLKIKKTSTFICGSIGGTFIELIFLHLSSYGVLKLFSVKNVIIWLLSSFIVFTLVAWIQGNLAGVMLDYNPFWGGLIAVAKP